MKNTLALVILAAATCFGCRSFQGAVGLGEHLHRSTDLCFYNNCNPATVPDAPPWCDEFYAARKGLRELLQTLEDPKTGEADVTKGTAPRKKQLNAAIKRLETCINGRCGNF